MAKIQEIVLSLESLDGSGYSFGDLISDIFGVGSMNAQVGVFPVIHSEMKSLVVKDVLYVLETGSELDNEVIMNYSVFYGKITPVLIKYLILNTMK
jgi:hypothetical protein